jgi:hypothetical protein
MVRVVGILSSELERCRNGRVDGTVWRRAIDREGKRKMVGSRNPVVPEKTDVSEWEDLSIPVVVLDDRLQSAVVVEGDRRKEGDGNYGIQYVGNVRCR